VENRPVFVFPPAFEFSGVRLQLFLSSVGFFFVIFACTLRIALNSCEWAPGRGLPKDQPARRFSARHVPTSVPGSSSLLMLDLASPSLFFLLCGSQF